MIKKYKESKIVKKSLRWINLLVGFRNKCNIDIERENSTGSLSIINRAYLIQQGQNEKVCPFSCEFCEISKNLFSERSPPVAASGVSE